MALRHVRGAAPLVAQQVVRGLGALRAATRAHILRRWPTIVVVVAAVA